MPTEPASLLFGRFELQPLQRRLLADGVPVRPPLGGRAFDLLLELATSAGALRTRNELIERVWPGRVVEENNLSVQINALRKVLGTEVLETVPGHGYRLAMQVQPVTPPPAAGPNGMPLPARLPALQSLLIGRSDDLAALGTLVEQHRLVTLVGAGGIGKTRLAQALLQLRAGAHAHGVCWVELGALDDAAALPATLAAALGLRPTPGDALAGLLQAVAGVKALVALDNAEHLLDGVAALVTALLEAAPGLHLLVTSQAPLRLAAERVMRLGPLAVPQGPLPAHAAQAFGAVALFAERAAAADQRFVLGDAQAAGVIELCRRLDGLALAIELAAARAPLLGVDTLVQSLGDRLRLLGGNHRRDAPARQRTLRAALEWSHGLLDPREQRLFARLAVLAGSAPLTLVQRIAADPDGPLDDWGLLDALDLLAQRSLVDVVIGGGDEPAGYRLLESPRALALERLQSGDEAELIRARHARGVLAELAAGEAALWAGRTGVMAWQRQAEQLLDNARDGLAWARAHGDDRLALALAATLLPRLPPALHDERLALADLAQTLAETLAAAGSESAALAQRGWLAVSMALANQQPARSRLAAMRSLELARSLHAQALSGETAAQLYQALCEAADVVADADEAAAAEALLSEAAALEDPGWPPVRRRSALRVRASIAAARGDAAQSLPLYRRLLDLSRAAGDPSWMTQINLADIELWSGDAAAAVGRGRALVAQLVALRDDNHLAYARLNLAAALLAPGWQDGGALTEARAVLQAVWQAARRVGRCAWCIDSLALLRALEGDAEAAARLAGAADARYEQSGEPRQAVEAASRRRVQALAEAQLGIEAAAQAVADGRSLDDESAAACAALQATD